MANLFDGILYRFRKSNTGVVHVYELTPEKTRFISIELNCFMSESKAFLRSRYAIRNLADDVNIPSYQLSAFLNREIGLNFNDFLNYYRVKYCKELIKQGLISDLNLKGIALQCGFNNRNTFSTAFKKFTGISPSYYLKRIAKIIGKNDRHYNNSNKLGTLQKLLYENY
jgi:AraC-like DNA-binding protein